MTVLAGVAPAPAPAQAPLPRPVCARRKALPEFPVFPAQMRPQERPAPAQTARAASSLGAVAAAAALAKT